MKTILITGCDRGLGLALAGKLLADGERVIATCLEPAGEGVQTLATKYATRCRVVRLDVADTESVTTAATEIRGATDHLDRLINNAARLGDIEHGVGDAAFSPDDVARTINVNTLGPLRVTHALWPLLLAGESRLVVNITSEAASIAQNWRDRWFGYSLSKAALNMEGALLHRRLRPLGGRVMLVHPGYLRTFMHGARNEQASYEADEAARLVLTAIERRAAQPAREAPEFFDLHGHDLPW